MGLPPPPSGFDIAESMIAANVSIEAVLRAACFAAVILRFIARRVARLSFWWDDWLIFVLAFLFIPATATKFYSYGIGLGRHIWWVVENESSTLGILGKLSYIDNLHYVPSVVLIRLSILCLYTRIFWVNRRFVWACYIQMVLVILWGIVSEAIWLFQCSPTWLTWTVPRPNDIGSCFQFRSVFVRTMIFGVLTDYAVLITPIYTVWSLHLSRHRKLLVTGVLILGAGECIFSTLRVVKTAQLALTDVTWDRATLSLWCATECDMGIICACIPTLGTLLPKRWDDPTASVNDISATRFSHETTPGAAETRQSGLSSGMFSLPIQDEESQIAEQGSVDSLWTTEIIIGHKDSDIDSAHRDVISSDLIIH